MVEFDEIPWTVLNFSSNWKLYKYAPYLYFMFLEPKSDFSVFPNQIKAFPL